MTGRSLSFCAVLVSEEDPLLSRVYPARPRPAALAFQRDRERIVQARAFRRLAGKTQVFTSRVSDHFRSRLTHTIEVAQIARDVAAQLGLNEELAEALALVHDIGHPPFGHAGERALDGCLREHGLRFDHNLHALRICEHFETRYAAHRGLNLTLAVREGIIKHSRDYSAVAHPELAPYFLGQRPPLEAQIIDLVDEIAYLTADLDDGVESGLLRVEHIRQEVPLFATCYSKVEAMHPGTDEKLLFHESLQWMQNFLADDLVAGTDNAVRAAGVRSLEDVRRHPARLARFTPETEVQRLEEKAYLYRELYNCPELTAEHDKAEEVVQTLFHSWIERPEELPSSYVEEIASEGLARVVADYIAGMTDGFILQRYDAARQILRR